MYTKIHQFSFFATSIIGVYVCERFFFLIFCKALSVQSLCCFCCCLTLFIYVQFVYFTIVMDCIPASLEILICIYMYVYERVMKKVYFLFYYKDTLVYLWTHIYEYLLLFYFCKCLYHGMYHVFRSISNSSVIYCWQVLNCISLWSW